MTGASVPSAPTAPLNACLPAASALDPRELHPQTLFPLLTCTAVFVDVYFTWFIYLFIFWLCCKACGSLASDQGWNLFSQQ